MIPFTQFMMPDGRPVERAIERGRYIEAEAHRLIDCGVRFEIELLTTGEVSMTAERGEEVWAHVLCVNGPEVPPAVDRLITEASARLIGIHPESK